MPSGDGPLSVLICPDAPPSLPDSMQRILLPLTATPPPPSCCRDCDLRHCGSPSATSLSHCGRCTSFPIRYPGLHAALSPNDGNVVDAPRPIHVRELPAPRLVLRGDRYTVIKPPTPQKQSVVVEEKVVVEEEPVDPGYVKVEE